MLADYLELREKERVWQAYTADMLWAIGKGVHGKGFAYPSYTELTGETKKDERTGDEIVADLIKKLEGGG